MSSAENDPRALWSRVTQAAAELRIRTIEERAEAIAKVAAKLASCDDDALLTQLAQSSGLSVANVQWGLRTTFEAFSFEALVALARSRPHAVPEGAVAVVLAGNVLTAAARPLLLPLLVGAPVLAKASSRDDALPFLLARMLSDADPVMGASCAVLSFPHEDQAKLDALLVGASSVHVLGSDEAVTEVRARRAPEARFVGRGHGLGIGFVASDALRSEQHARDAAAAFARDVTAYDQRGCLSPHAIVVQEREGSAVRTASFATLLSQALTELETAFPRGSVPVQALAEQVQWRGVAAARGELHVGAQHSVSYEHTAPLRPSPGYRNIGVYSLGASSLRDRAASFAFALKALGIASRSLDTEVTRVAPYACHAGRMQTPPLDAPLDGLHPLTGY